MRRIARSSSLFYSTFRSRFEENPLSQHCFVRRLYPFQSNTPNLLQCYVFHSIFKLFQGFGDRLLAEVKRLAPRDVKVRVSDVKYKNLQLIRVLVLETASC